MRAKIISPADRNSAVGLREEEEEEEEEGVEGVHAARALVLARPTPRPRIGDVPKRAGGRRASMLAWAAGGPPPWGHDRRRNRIVEMGGAGMGGERQVHPPSQRGSGIYGPGSIQTRVSRDPAPAPGSVQPWPFQDPARSGALADPRWH
ncbi:unnamed protein product [Prorocentrum cordatum]|uniref:Uncharacterized protein n=1 Tax=Prorocentrum cordatum TaxID=2364126 RepID=A0ABN9QJP4_9DINO|nr:unnamed protein product [Polarella glacialis]